MREGDSVLEQSVDRREVEVESCEVEEAQRLLGILGWGSPAEQLSGREVGLLLLTLLVSGWLTGKFREHLHLDISDNRMDT